MSASSATTPPPSEIQNSLPFSSQNGSPSNSSESSKKRAISEVAEDSTAPMAGCSGDTKRPAKKTKLTEAEMEEKRKAKEAKEKGKVAKEKEKAVKEEEKAAKKAERDEKKRVRDQEKRKKDEERKKRDDEKKKKDEEKARKDRTQTRLQNFFVKPASTPNSPSKVTTAPPVPGPNATSLEFEAKQERSDYEKNFQPFFVKSNVTVAPPHCFQRDNVCKSAMKASIDKTLSFPKGSNSPDDLMQPVPGVGTATSQQIAELLHIPPHKCGSRGRLLSYTTKDLLARVNAPDDSSLPLIIDWKTYEASKGEGGVAIYFKMLNRLPNKFLGFAEDVRPPYSGTFTRKPTTSGLRKGRNPFQRTLPNIDYDYDSEAEWEEGVQEDGEELLSDDGEEDEEAESLDDEMDGFLDDEEDEATKGRRGALAALVPLSSGLCWEDEDGRNTRAEFEEMKMEVLLEGISGPIDPFSTAYWNPPPKNVKALTNFLVPATSVSKPSLTLMEPPRLPSAAINRPQVTNVAIGVEAVTVKKGKSVALVPAEDLDAFKRAVEGSDMTKAGLIEVLKKQFPKIGKESIKQTLTRVAARVGDRERDKRWVLI